MFIPRTRLFWSVSLGHFVNDMFSAMGPVVLAFVATTVLPMSNTQIGLAVSAMQLMGATSQPFFGIRADRTGGRWMAAVGQVWLVGMFMLALAAAQLTGQYILLLVPYVFMSLGSGAIHPVGALHAAESDKTRIASSMSYFFLMGQLGLGIGPALAGFLLDAANPSGAAQTTLAPIYLLSVLAIPSVFIMAFTIPANRYHAADMAKPKRDQKLSLKDLPWGAFGVLILMISLRGLAQPGSVNFLPVLFREKGWDPSEYGLITSSFWIASGIAGILFGELADRYDLRHVLLVSMILCAPAFFFLPVVNGPLAFLLAIAAGGLSGGTHSLIVVMAQKLIPASKGFASGAILGLIFGTGALGGLVIGTVSDVIGLGPTFQLVAIAAALSGIVALWLPVSKPKRTPPETIALEKA